MLTTTAGQLLLNDALPEDMRDYSRKLDKKGVNALLDDLGSRHPGKYRETLFKLTELGREFAYLSGGNTFGAQHLRSGQSTHQARGRIQAAIAAALQEGGTEEERQAKINAAVDNERDWLTKALYEESLAEQNPLGLQVLSGARGNPTNLRSLRGFDGAYEDHHGNRISIPILRNYAQGLSPAEYWAGTYGARKGVIDVKTATADAGYLAKQLVQLTHRLLVSADDDEDADPTNPDRRGMPVSTGDRESAGALLAADAGPYKRNTVLTPKILADLRNRDVNDILIRSPIVGGPADGGVYAKDVGVRERGMMAPIGDYVGIAAAQALSEKLTQAQLSSKHSGGVAGAGPTGFKAVDQLLQTPEAFHGGATHAQKDGYISGVREAPQGGKYVRIGDEDHYVPPDRELRVKDGDEVEAGDILSSGLPNPAEIVRHKGIGEGRRYFVNLFHDMYKRSGMGAHRRNIELVTRGLINHVRMNDMWDEFAPDDVVPYHMIERNWTPRPGTQTLQPKAAVGQFLERPVLHYSIGTKVRKSMLPVLQQHGVQNIQAHRDAPPFEPEMLRAATSISTDQDWMPRMLGSGQKGSLLDAVHRGAVSDTAGTSYVPALAEGPDFGVRGPTKGWRPTG